MCPPLVILHVYDNLPHGLATLQQKYSLLHQNYLGHCLKSLSLQLREVNAVR